MGHLLRVTCQAVASVCTVPKKVPFLENRVPIGAFFYFLGPYFYFKGSIFSVLSNLRLRMSIQSPCAQKLEKTCVIDYRSVYDGSLPFICFPL